MLYSDGDVATVLDRLGIDYDERYDELLAICPMHLSRTGSVDHNPSWSINTETGVHHCFSCSYRGSLLGLVVDVLDLTLSSGASDWDSAKLWLSQFTVVDLEKTSEKLEGLKDSYVKSIKPPPMSEARLAVYDDVPDWVLEQRGIDFTSCLRYKVRWSPTDNCWIIPVRDPLTFKLIGWQEKGQGNRYFKNRPAGLMKSRALFGYETKPTATVVVVESPLDVLKLDTWGYSGLATYGSSVSYEQIKLLSGMHNLIFAMDNDKAGRTSTKEIRRLCREYGMEYSVFNYSETNAKDIGDMTQEEFEQGLMTSTHCSLGGLIL
jgi:hypothetical protein